LLGYGKTPRALSIVRSCRNGTLPQTML
jgi:hypothetical protein